MADSVAAAIATNRFGLGARPGELARVAPDPRGWLAAQLHGGAPSLPAGSALESSASILVQAAKLPVPFEEDALATVSAAAVKWLDSVDMSGIE